MKLNKVILVLGVIALVNSYRGSAAAGEVYPGLSCQPRLGVDAVYINSYYSDVTNVKGPHDSTERVQVRCPIVRKNVNSTAPVKVYLRIRNGSAAQNSLCNVFAFDWRGTAVREGSRVTISGGNNFQGITMPAPTSYAGGTLLIQCDLSRNSALVNYYVEE